MTGGSAGTNGTHAPWRATGLLVLLFAAVCSVNAFTIIDENRWSRLETASWVPFALEYSSFVGLVAALGIPFLLSGALPVSVARRWRRFVVAMVVIAAGSWAFSTVHVAIMLALRHMLWAWHDQPYIYRIGDQWLFEYRKDALCFLIATAAMLVDRARSSPHVITEDAPRIHSAVENAPPGQVFLQDATRTVAVPLDGLQTLMGNGNYIEAIYGDGTSRLLRTTLTAADAVLSDLGFVRVHKSWLVNREAVIKAERNRSGDGLLYLPGNIRIPLSRRYARSITRSWLVPN